MASHAQAALEGQPWNQATLDAALLAVAQDVNITPDAPGPLLAVRAWTLGVPCWAVLCGAAVRCAVL